jgi:hypothetical protein
MYMFVARLYDIKALLQLRCICMYSFLVRDVKYIKPHELTSVF